MLQINRKLNSKGRNVTLRTNVTYNDNSPVRQTVSGLVYPSFSNRLQVSFGVKVICSDLASLRSIPITVMRWKVIVSTMTITTRAPLARWFYNVAPRDGDVVFLSNVTAGAGGKVYGGLDLVHL